MANGDISAKKKRGWVLFWIEAGVLIVVAGVLLFLLNYFQIVSFSKFVPIAGYLPTKKPAYLETNSKDPITASSQRPDYTLTLRQPDQLLKYFSGYDIWQRAAADLGKNKPFKKAIIVLTKDAALQHKYAYAQPIPVTFAYQVNAVDDTMVIFVYVADSTLQSEIASELMGSIVVQILAIYRGKDPTQDLPVGENTNNLFILKHVGSSKGTGVTPAIITPKPPKI